MPRHDRPHFDVEGQGCACEILPTGPARRVVEELALPPLLVGLFDSISLNTLTLARRLTPMLHFPYEWPR